MATTRTVLEQREYVVAGHTAWAECPSCGAERGIDLHRPLAGRVLDCGGCGARWRVVTQGERLAAEGR